MWIFRDAARTVGGAEIIAELRRARGRVAGTRGEERRRAAVDALVLAGEVEAALADARDPAADAFAALTDGFARAALGREEVPRVPMDGLEHAALALSRAEGFAYYALHPEAYARAAVRAAEELGSDEVIIVGLRTIGAALSAAALAALRARGVRSRRLTVRPAGAPFDRRVHVPPLSGDVLVVDEGPGLSGSSLIGAAEAAVRAGARRVVVVCSRAPNPDVLRAPNGAARWRALRVIVADATVRMAAFAEDLSAGAWRARALAPGAAWPSTWASSERRKGIAADGRMVKFEGLGPSGREARARCDALAGAGFVEPIVDCGDGYCARAWRDARPATGAELDARWIGALAAYCAARPRLCPAACVSELSPMVATNSRRALGRELVPALPVERPAIVDGRMMPYEWLLEPGGRALKMDAIAHGDDHFLPGPTDVAWDLAGAIVEWAMDAPRQRALIAAYARASGDDPRRRLDGWITAYLAFRVGFVATALEASRGASDRREERRLARDLERYVALLGVRAGGAASRVPRAR